MAFGQHDRATLFLNFENSLNLGLDVSGKNNNGVASNVTSTAILAGKTNVATFSPAADSGIDLTTILPQFSSSAALSFSGWMYLNEIGGAGSVRCVFSASDNTQASREIILFVEANQLKFQVRNAVAVFQIVGGTLVANTWYHVAFSSGASGAKLWLNGVSIGTNISVASIGSIITNRAQIGYNVDSANGGLGREFEFNGSLKDCLLSTFEIGNSTVLDIYNNDIYSYEVIGLLGQSNQIGRADAVPGIDDDYSLVSGKVFQWGYNANARLAALNPLDHVNELAGDMGHWLVMCNNLVPSLAYKQAIMLVPGAQGGTGFITNHWNVGNQPYETVVTRLNSAKNYHALSNMRMLHWIQGETDADNGNLLYQANITAMHDDLMLRVAGLSASVPFVAVTIKGSTAPANVPVINGALLSFANTNEFRHLIDATSLTLFDQFHYNAASLRTIGLESAKILVPLSNPPFEFVTRNPKSRLVELGFAGPFTQLMNSYLAGLGFTGQVNDQIQQHLRSLGYSGPVSEMLKQKATAEGFNSVSEMMTTTWVIPD